MKRLVYASCLVAAAAVAVGVPVWAEEPKAAPGESAALGESAVPSESARPGESAASVESAAPGAGRRDLYLDMPYYVGGFEPVIVMTRGAEHVANLDAEDPTRLQLEALLAAVGAEIEDLTSGYALVSQEGFFAFVVAVRVEGVEPDSLLPAYLPILYEDLIEPTPGIARTIGGKDVVVIASLGDAGEDVELSVYDQGDTLWMVQGPDDVVETTLENLPRPTDDE